MPADASIFAALRPQVQLQDPLEQYGKMISIKSLIGGEQLNEMQRTKLARDMAEEEQFKTSIADWAKNGGQGALTPETWAASPARAAALEKTRTEMEKARAELFKTKLETGAKALELHRDELANVNTPQDAAAWVKSAYSDPTLAPLAAHGGTLEQALSRIPTDPAAFAEWKRNSSVGAGKLLELNQQLAAQKENERHHVATEKQAVIHTRVQAATQDPFGNLGIRDMVEGQLNGRGGATRPAAGATAGMADLHGDDFLKTLPRAQSDQIKALADGRLQFPTGQALRTPYWQNMVSQVAQYDPSFDAINYNARSATRKAFTSGPESKSINALNTVMGHLDELDKAAKDLNNSGFTLWNEYVSNPIAGAVSPEFKGRLNKFNLTKQAVVDEMEKAYRGSSGAQGGIEAWKKTLSSADSYQALRSSIQQGVKLLNSKMEALGDQYSKGMGTTKSGLELLNDHARTTFNRLVRDADAGGAAEPGKTAGGGIKFLGWEK